MATSTGKGEQHRKLHPPFAQPGPGRRATPHMAGETSEESGEGDADSLELPASSAAADAALDSSDSLPWIERFVDDLPLIDDFLLQLEAPASLHAGSAKSKGSAESVQTAETETGTDSEGWAAGDWQSYDWSGLASLGAPAPEAAEAHAAWTSTNWDAGRRALSDTSTHLHEDEVAAALDEIARRIRSGELSLRQFRGSPPEAAIAAAFASLLRSRG